MLANVNATRMELLRLRKRVSLAGRGHRLLSEKRDEISRQLIQIARDIKPLRERVEKELLETSRRFMLARAVVEPEHTKAALAVPTKKFKLAVEFANVMNVKVPHLAKEISGRYDAVFRQALESLALPERELPWTLVLRGRQYLMRDDLDVPGNMVETGSEWSGFPIYRRRSASGGRLFLPRGENGLFQAYEEMSYSVERARLASVAQSLQLTSYLAPPELVDIRLTIDLLNRAAGRYFERTFGLNLDGSKRSLEEVESLLRFRDWTGELMGGNSFSWTAGMIGAYFGEMLRQNGHLYWSPRKPYLASVLATREGASIEPFKVAAKALVEPDSLLLGGAYGRALRGVFPHPVHHSRAA